jgi:ABC-type hemin transport system ATPase subunit
VAGEEVIFRNSAVFDGRVFLPEGTCVRISSGTITAVGPAVSYILISHDLAVVRQLTEEAIVLHRGEVVERGDTAQILDDPQYAYTQRLRASVPRPGWKPARRP